MAIAELVRKTFDAAKASGHLVFYESTREKYIVDGLQYLVTLAPTLQKKPTKQDNDQTEKPASPWNPPEKELLVVDDFENDFRIVLNKFAVVPRHFLLVTKKIEPQTAPLTPIQLSAAFKLLQQVNEESKIRHVGFFNCGEKSGASVAHKHIQFMELADPDFKPFVDEIVAINGDYQDGQRPLTDTRASFAHFVVPLPANPTDDELGFRYSTLMSRVLTLLRREEDGSTVPSYNFVFTEQWMMATPRRAEKYEGISINSVGTIGLLLAKSDEDVQVLKKDPAQVLHEIAYPPVDLNENEGCYDY